MTTIAEQGKKAKRRDGGESAAPRSDGPAAQPSGPPSSRAAAESRFQPPPSATTGVGFGPGPAAQATRYPDQMPSASPPHPDSAKVKDSTRAQGESALPTDVETAERDTRNTARDAPPEDEQAELLDTDVTAMFLALAFKLPGIATAEGYRAFTEKIVQGGEQTGDDPVERMLASQLIALNMRFLDINRKLTGADGRSLGTLANVLVQLSSAFRATIRERDAYRLSRAKRSAN